MFKLFNHGANKSESQTLNTTEGEEQIKIEDSAELTYQMSDYQEVVNEIDLDPNFFIKEVEAVIEERNEGLQDADPAEFTFSEGGADENIVSFEAPSKDVEPKKLKTTGFGRVVKNATSLATAFTVLSMAACEKREEIKFGVGSQAGDNGPVHRLKVAFSFEQHTDAIGPDGVPVKKTKEGKIIGADGKEIEPKNEPQTEVKTEAKAEPKTETEKGNVVNPVSTKEPHYSEPTSADAGSKEAGDHKVEPAVKPEVEHGVEHKTEAPEEDVVKPKHEEETKPAPERPTTESTSVNHDGPGKKIEKYTEAILPSGDFENGAIVLNDTALKAISEGCLAYSRESHCFATSLTKDFRKQGLSAEAVTIYGLHRGDKLRPPMPGKYFSDYAKVISQNPLKVDFRYFDMKKFDQDLRNSVNKANYTNAKGVLDSRKYNKAVEDVTDYGHETYKALIAWIKLGGQEQAKEALFKEKCDPFMNRK